VLVGYETSPDMGTGQLAGSSLGESRSDPRHAPHVKDGLGAAYMAGFAWGETGVHQDGRDGRRRQSRCPSRLGGNLLPRPSTPPGPVHRLAPYVEAELCQNWPWRRWACLDGQHLREADLA